jgi:hypothetical protein
MRRSTARPRRYIPRALLFLLRPLLRYSSTREAYVLRLLGGSLGPVLRPARRDRPEPAVEGVERRSARIARVGH